MALPDAPSPPPASAPLCDNTGHCGTAYPCRCPAHCVRRGGGGGPKTRRTRQLRIGSGPRSEAQHLSVQRGRINVPGRCVQARASGDPGGRIDASRAAGQTTALRQAKGLEAGRGARGVLTGKSSPGWTRMGTPLACNTSVRGPEAEEVAAGRQSHAPAAGTSSGQLPHRGGQLTCRPAQQPAHLHRLCVPRAAAADLVICGVWRPAAGVADGGGDNARQPLWGRASGGVWRATCPRTDLARNLQLLLHIKPYRRPHFPPAQACPTTSPGKPVPAPRSSRRPPSQSAGPQARRLVPARSHA